jgi:cyd operon protein YbgT
MWYFAWILGSLSPAPSAFLMLFGMSTICRKRRSTLRRRCQAFTVVTSTAQRGPILVGSEGGV